MTILTNSTQAYRVFERLISAYRAREFPYTQANLDRLPQRRIPKELRRKPNFYFYLCHFMRGLIKSEYAVAQMVKLYREEPKLFDPRHVVTLSPEIMEEKLGKLFGKLPKSQRYGEAWFRNSEILMAWGGDILNVFRGRLTADILRQRVVNKKDYQLPLKEQGFFMFQEKVCAMLAYFLMDAQLIPLIHISPPVDFHHLRVMLSTEMILASESFRRPRPLSVAGYKLAEQYLRYRYGVHPVEFSDLLFMLSREGCARSIKEEPEDWNDAKTLRRYQRSCGRCPVEKECHHSILAQSYYPRGDEARATRAIQVIPRPKPPCQ